MQVYVQVYAKSYGGLRARVQSSIQSTIWTFCKSKIRNRFGSQPGTNTRKLLSRISDCSSETGGRVIAAWACLFRFAYRRKRKRRRAFDHGTSAADSLSAFLLLDHEQGDLRNKNFFSCLLLSRIVQLTACPVGDSQNRDWASTIWTTSGVCGDFAPQNDEVHAYDRHRRTDRQCDPRKHAGKAQDRWTTGRKENLCAPAQALQNRSPLPALPIDPSVNCTLVVQSISLFSPLTTSLTQCNLRWPSDQRNARKLLASRLRIQQLELSKSTRGCMTSDCTRGQPEASRTEKKPEGLFGNRPFHTKFWPRYSTCELEFSISFPGRGTLIPNFGLQKVQKTSSGAAPDSSSVFLIIVLDQFTRPSGSSAPRLSRFLSSAVAAWGACGHARSKCLPVQPSQSLKTGASAWRIFLRARSTMTLTTSKTRWCLSFIASLQVPGRG